MFVHSHIVFKLIYVSILLSKYSYLGVTHIHINIFRQYSYKNDFCLGCDFSYMANSNITFILTCTTTPKSRFNTCPHNSKGKKKNSFKCNLKYTVIKLESWSTVRFFKF